MFTKNVEFKGPTQLTSWRKIAIGTWSSCGDPSVYGTIEIDASSMLNFIKKKKEEGVRVTPTILVAKAAALSIREYPIVNTVLRMGRLYERKDIDIFLQVAPESKDDNLSGVLIRKCDEKALSDISSELQSSAKRIKSGDDFEYKKMKGIIRKLPAVFVPLLMKLTSYFMYEWNLWSPLFNAPRDSFGSLMVTSVGMLGIDNGYAPLVPYSRCPAVMAVGEIKERPSVYNGELCIRPMLSIGVTMDHRHIDGKGASYMLKAFRKYLENPV